MKLTAPSNPENCALDRYVETPETELVPHDVIVIKKE